MKIIIFSILFTVQAQNMYDDLISNENSSPANDLSLITRIINNNDRTISLETGIRFDIDKKNFSTSFPGMISSGGTHESPTRSFSSFLPTSDYDLTTPSEDTNNIIEEQWFNVNQSSRRDPYRSLLSWKHSDDSSRHGATYILKSEPRCIRQMCSVRLKYNGTLASRTSGCLSFSLRTRGQPVGQLWIVEDQESENTSQKIQLINKTLRIEHSLRSKIKNLSIETQILFRNPQTDSLILSNLNVNWKGPCPKRRPVPTPSSDILARRATLEDDLMTLSSDGSSLMNTLTTNEEFESSQDYLTYESTTIGFNDGTGTKRPFSFLNQKNIGWFLSLVAVFCFLAVLSAVGHSLWLIRQQHHFIWHVTFDSQIQFLARRSIRSSTRSENKIATISQIAYDILKSDLQKEQIDTSTTNSSRSTPMSYYTYL